MNPNDSAILKDVVTAFHEMGRNGYLSSRTELDDAGETEASPAQVDEVHDDAGALFRLDAGLHIPAWNPRMAAFIDRAPGRLQIIDFVTDGYEIWLMA